jgi:uncharacterized protein (DUF885 family)
MRLPRLVPWWVPFVAPCLAPVIATAVLLAATPTARASDDAARTLHALFDEQWEASARMAPEWATFRGDHRHGDRLSDQSPPAIAERDRATRQWLARAEAIPAGPLNATDRLSREVFIHQLRREVEMQGFEGYRRQSLKPGFGFQQAFAGLLRNSPVEQPAQVEQILSRMAALPRRVDQEIALLREAAKQGWVASRPVLQRVLDQLDGQLKPAAGDGPFFEPFTRLPVTWPAAQREALQSRGRAAIEAHVLPAMQRLRRVVADELWPKAPAEGGLSHRPDGERLYAALVRHQTTTSLSPREIHALGQAELARLEGEMHSVMREVNYTGTLKDFTTQLRTEPQHYHASPEAMLANYREIAKRIDPELPRLFAELPRSPYGIRAMPAFVGPGVADNYTAPPLDGSRGGWYNANTQAYQRRPKWAMETLVAHETVPGHHLQSARARELQGLPPFRRSAWFVAYGEGWALYAETLGPQLGLFADPYSRFGHLQAQAFRAMRLVVDTGLHALGWTRQQAIDYIVAHSGDKPDYVAAEIDRYIADPGQALGYMVGKLRFDALRDKAKAALGERFDLRRFHMAVLDTGPVPLDVLERVVDDWIALERAATPG